MSGIKDHLVFRIDAAKRLGASNGFQLDEFILKNGKRYEATEDSFEVHRGEPQECFANCARLAQAYNEYNYVEGYVMIYSIPIQHAWLVDTKGKLIEPTLIPKDHARIGEYFGVEFSTDYVIKSMFANRCYGLLDGYHNQKTIADLIEGRADFAPRRSQ